MINNLRCLQNHRTHMSLVYNQKIRKKLSTFQTSEHFTPAEHAHSACTQNSKFYSDTVSERECRY